MIEVYIEGASAGNPGPSGAGIFIKGHGSAEKYYVPLGSMSNHEAEYYALIHGLKICLEKNYRTVSFRTDSELVDRAVEKRCAKNKKFSPRLEEALLMADELDLFFMKWIPSAENKTADELARLAIRKNNPNDMQNS